MQPNYGPTQPAASQWYPAMGSPPAPPEGRGGRGLAITALVLSIVALLLVLVVGAVVVFTAAAFTEEGGEVLTGQLSAPPAGPVTGDILAQAVTARIIQDGGDVSRMDCPRTPKVGQGVVTVCHGVVESTDWAIVVLFEDEDGRFTLVPA